MTDPIWKPKNLIPIRVVKGDRLEFFLLGLVGLAESLVHVFSLGFITTHWRGDFLFREREDD